MLPEARSRSSRRVLLGVAAVVAIGLAVAPACSTQPTQGRFPVCKVDADCANREGAGAHCYDLRCVDCRGDDDCKPGSVCNVAKQCESLSSSPATESDAGIPKETWESSTPADHDRCVAACKGKGKDCLERCGSGPASHKK